MSGEGTVTIIEPLLGVQSVTRHQHMTTDKVLPAAPVIKELSMPQHIKLRMNIYMGIRVRVNQQVVVNINEPTTGVVKVKSSLDDWSLSEQVKINDLEGFTLDQLPK